MADCRLGQEQAESIFLPAPFPRRDPQSQSRTPQCECNHQADQNREFFRGCQPCHQDEKTVAEN